LIDVISGWVALDADMDPKIDLLLSCLFFVLFAVLIIVFVYHIFLFLRDQKRSTQRRRILDASRREGKPTMVSSLASNLFKSNVKDISLGSSMCTSTTVDLNPSSNSSLSPASVYVSPNDNPCGSIASYTSQFLKSRMILDIPPSVCAPSQLSPDRESRERLPETSESSSTRPPPPVLPNLGSTPDAGLRSLSGPMQPAAPACTALDDVAHIDH
jgi:hypothetical protein